jgi:hypothetical protein
VITRDNAIQELRRFSISEEEISTWVHAFGLTLDSDANGNTLFSSRQLDFFRNIKKQIALGKTLAEIKNSTVLPATPVKSFATPTVTAPTIDFSELPERIHRAENKTEAEPPITESDEFLDFLQHPADQSLDALLSNAQPLERIERSTVSISWPDEEADLLDEADLTIELPQVIEEQSQEEREAILAAYRLEEAKTQTLEEEVSNSLPQAVGSNVIPARFEQSKRYGTQTLSARKSQQSGPNAGLVTLIDRLISEKDDLQTRLDWISKQNSHLYQANQIFKLRIKELELDTTQASFQLDQNKVIDDKSQLQKQVIDAELKLVEQERQMLQLQQKISELNLALANRVSPEKFVGHWTEEAKLSRIVFDDYGINIDETRSRAFKISTLPERCFGHTAILETQYNYQNNPLWKRQETMVLNLVNENTLQGELTLEYVLDNVTVGKALYHIRCVRNGIV